MKREDFTAAKEIKRPVEFKEDRVQLTIEADETYPDFSITPMSKEQISKESNNGVEIFYKLHEVTKEQLEWINRVEREHREVQVFLANLYGWRE